MPDDTRELIDLGRFQILVLAVAVLLTVAGAGLAAWWRQRGAPRGLARGLFIAALGPLIAALWFIYNAIVERLGLDSVAALGFNLGIFLVFGLIAGAIGRALWAPEDGDQA
ncbi:MAG: hypothetical protein HY320_13830 [Armatimonadetes bacterium]|nr:hypothetical protein [Armatimonadota bacterium]